MPIFQEMRSRLLGNRGELKYLFFWQVTSIELHFFSLLWKRRKKTTSNWNQKPHNWFHKLFLGKSCYERGEKKILKPDSFFLDSSSVNIRLQPTFDIFIMSFCFELKKKKKKFLRAFTDCSFNVIVVSHRYVTMHCHSNLRLCREVFTPKKSSSMTEFSVFFPWRPATWDISTDDGNTSTSKCQRICVVWHFLFYTIKSKTQSRFFSVKSESINKLS